MWLGNRYGNGWTNRTAYTWLWARRCRRRFVRAARSFHDTGRRRHCHAPSPRRPPLTSSQSHPAAAQTHKRATSYFARHFYHFTPGQGLQCGGTHQNAVPRPRNIRPKAFQFAILPTSTAGPGRGGKYCDQRVLMFVCLSVRAQLNKKLSCRRGTARCTMSVEILSTDAQLYEQITFGKACSV